MKKFIKICLIIAGVCGGIGILFCTAAFAMGGYQSAYELAKKGALTHGKWHISADGIYYGADGKEEEWEDLEKAEWEESEAVSVGEEKSIGANRIQYIYETAGIKNLVADMGAADIAFRVGERADAIVVTLYNCKKEDFEGAFGETLYLDYEPQYNQVLVGKNTNRRIVVEIPKGMHFDLVDIDMGAANVTFAAAAVSCDILQMDVGAGNMKADSLNVAEKFTVDVAAGNIEIYGGTYQDMELSCGMGNFRMQGAAAGDITAECGMGNMELYLQGEADMYDYALSCGAGKMVVNGEKYAGIAGDYAIKNEGAAGMVELSCGMGNMNFTMKEGK